MHRQLIKCEYHHTGANDKIDEGWNLLNYSSFKLFVFWMLQTVISRHPNNTEPLGVLLGTPVLKCLLWGKETTAQLCFFFPFFADRLSPLAPAAPARAAFVSDHKEAVIS